MVHYINKQTIIGESITGSVRQFRRECTVGEVERTGLRTGLSGCTEDSGVECPEMLTIQQGQNPSQVRIYFLPDLILIFFQMIGVQVNEKTNLDSKHSFF